MKKLVFNKDIVDAMSDANMNDVRGGIIINTSTRPTITVIDTSKTVTDTVSDTLYTKGSCPSCMAC